MGLCHWASFGSVFVLIKSLSTQKLGFTLKSPLVIMQLAKLASCFIPSWFRIIVVLILI